MRNLHNVDELRERLQYCPETGVVIWIDRPRSQFKTERAWKIMNSRHAGKVAGQVRKDANLNHYFNIQIKVDGRTYYAHRVAWAIYHGAWPKEGMEIDHINGDSLDNRLCNLRLVTKQENGRNQKRRHDNSSGVSGVLWDKQHKKWRARITHKGKRIHIGRYDSIDEAAKARKSAERDYGYHANHGRPG